MVAPTALGVPIITHTGTQHRQTNIGLVSAGHMSVLSYAIACPAAWVLPQICGMNQTTSFLHFFQTSHFTFGHPVLKNIHCSRVHWEVWYHEAPAPKFPVWNKPMQRFPHEIWGKVLWLQKKRTYVSCYAYLMLTAPFFTSKYLRRLVEEGCTVLPPLPPSVSL